MRFAEDINNELLFAAAGISENSFAGICGENSFR